MTHLLHMGVVVEVALKTALASGMTLGVLRLMAARTAAERSFVAHLGLAATLAIPVAALLLPPLAVSGTFAWLCEIAVPLALYALPALAIGAITLVAVGRLFGLRNRATVLVEPAWLGALAHAQRRMGFKSGAALLVSPDIASPVSWGLFRPTIVLDERALGAKGEAEAIIAHELAHVARADWAKLLLARTTTALFWFNPLVWLLARQCHELREEAADDAVLRHEVDRSDYAAILVGHARHECRGLLLAANGVAPGKGSLRRRVTRVLDVKLRRAPAGLGFAAVGVLIGLMLGTPLAALTLRAPVAPAAPAAPHRIAAVQPVQPVAEVAAPAPWPELVPSSLPAVQAHADAAARDADASERLARETLARSDVKRAIADANYAVQRYSPGELVAMSVQGVTPGWLHEMAALGYGNLNGGEIAALASQDIDPAYVRGMAQAGYPRLTTGQLIALKVQDVTPDYVRQITRAGGPRLSPDQLVMVKVQGISAGMIRASVDARVDAAAIRVEVRQALKEAKLRQVAAPPAPPSRRMTMPPVPPRDTSDDD